MNLLDRIVAAWRSEQGVPATVDPVKLGRRKFLALLGGSVAVATVAPLVDLDQLIWTPSPSIIVPDLGHGFLAPEWVVRDTLALLRKNLLIATSFNRRYDEAFQGGTLGETIRIQLPERFDYVLED